MPQQEVRYNDAPSVIRPCECCNVISGKIQDARRSRCEQEELRDAVPCAKRLKASANEFTPLFPKTDPDRIAGLHVSRTKDDHVLGIPAPLVHNECGSLTSLTMQLLVSNMMDMLPPYIGGVWMGHLSDANSSSYIAARSLSSVFLFLTGNTVIIAVAAAMDTLCAQAYGAGKLHEMGIFLQTGMLLFGLCCIPVSVVSFFCVDIMVALGQREDIATLASYLVLFSLPALPLQMVNALICKIMQGQNLISPLMCAGILGNFAYHISIYVLMFLTPMGYIGSVVAMDILVFIYNVVLCVYCLQSDLIQREWPGWRLRDAIKLVPEFLRLGISGLGMVMFESWAFIAVSLLAGVLPYADIALSADSTYSSFRVLCALFYGTVALAGSVRVGNALGANDPERAKIAAYLSVALSVVVALVSSIIMLLSRNAYPYAYTTDEDVVRATSDLMLLTCPFQVFAGISAAGQGILRGCGLQRLGAQLNFLAFLVVAVPVSLTLSYEAEMGLSGLWLGLCSGFVCSGASYLYWVLHADWKAMATEAQQRTREQCECSSPAALPC